MTHQIAKLAAEKGQGKTAKRKYIENNQRVNSDGCYGETASD
jgi:hypothetical protein